MPSALAKGFSETFSLLATGGSYNTGPLPGADWQSWEATGQGVPWDTVLPARRRGPSCLITIQCTVGFFWEA